jgi:hypothetical protein
MITSLPAVQDDYALGFRHCGGSRGAHWLKRWANRRYRRALNLATRAMRRDPDRFDNESFETKSLSSWDIS